MSIQTDDRDEAEIRPWDDRVREAARLVESGTLTLADLEAYDCDDRDDEAFREAVRERADDDAATKTEEGDDGETITRTEAIGWRALFVEFGMHTPNAVGDLAVSTTKLVEAIRISEQNIAGDPRSHIERAVETDQLVAETANKADGSEMVAGYRLGGDV